MLYLALSSSHPGVLSAQSDILNLQIAAWCDPNTSSTPSQYTPMHHVVYVGNRTMAACVLNHPSMDVNRKDKKCMTPLHIAYIKSQRDLKGDLVRRRADLMALDNHGMHPKSYHFKRNK